MDELLAKLSTGLYSLSELTLAERGLCADILRPNPQFTPEQYDLMGQFFLEVAPGMPDPPVGYGWPILEKDGRQFLPSHLLTNIRPGEDWSVCAGYLIGLKFVKLGSNYFV